jgi:hypothetical protein
MRMSHANAGQMIAHHGYMRCEHCLKTNAMWLNEFIAIIGGCIASE